MRCCNDLITRTDSDSFRREMQASCTRIHRKGVNASPDESRKLALKFFRLGARSYPAGTQSFDYRANFFFAYVRQRKWEEITHQNSFHWGSSHFARAPFCRRAA
jgi:hypothetical protein